MEFWIPYGETEVPVRVPDDNFYKILEPNKPGRVRDPIALIRESLDKPVGDFSLSKTVKTGGVAGIVVDPMVPPRIRQPIVEMLQSRLAASGVGVTRLFLRKRLSNVAPTQASDSGPDFKTVDPIQGTFVEIGRTSLGNKVSIEQEFLSCDIKISLGMVTPHFASGFTGGPDIVLPGVSSLQTITKNRSLVIRGASTPGDSNENRVLSDSLEAYKLAGPFYSICLVPDGWEGIDSVFSGELESVFTEAVSRYSQIHSPKIDRRPDIILISADKFLGMDLYHTVRILPNAWNVMRKEGTIILAAECSRGVGDSSFLDYARSFPERKDLLSELRHHFRLGGHVNLLLQEALERYRIQLVSVLPDLYARNSFKLKPSRTATSAIQQAIRAEGKDAKILIITRGDLTIPTIAESS